MRLDDFHFFSGFCFIMLYEHFIICFIKLSGRVIGNIGYGNDITLLSATSTEQQHHDCK